MNWKDKKVLVTGSEGMIGKELVIQLEELEANVLWNGVDFRKYKSLDLRDKDSCEHICRMADYVFHLVGIKGSPIMTRERPVDFMGPMLQFDTNMILAAQQYGVKKFLYTSSIAVENPQTDKYPAWAKQTAETLIEAMRIQYPRGTEYCIVRPANVYGRFDNFDNPNAMVITSLISKASSPNNNTFEIWGDGTQIRDFINAKDVARGMIQTMEEMPNQPVKLASGKGISILEIAKIIVQETGKGCVLTGENVGDKKRVMDISKNPIDFKPQIDIKEGIKEVCSQFSTG